MRRRDDFVARTDSQRLKRKMQPGSGGIDRDGLDATTQITGELLLESAGLGARGNPAGSKRINDFGNLLFTYFRSGEGQELSTMV
jgi:hypothetical protein